MFIINTFKRRYLIPALCLWALAGCLPQDELQRARAASQAAGLSYAKAQRLYQQLLKRDRDLDTLHLELGLLYYQHGEFSKAVEEFKQTRAPRSRKYLALAYYRLGSFTDALEIFNKDDLPDEEYLYYRGLTCERLNLFDQALGAYKKIKGSDYAGLAAGRIEAINKETPSSPEKLPPEVAGLLSDSAYAQAYPQAGALILYADEKITLAADNTRSDQLHYIIRILRERGKEDFAEAKIEYDATDEKVELEYARTIKPDGTVVEVGSRHIRDVSQYLNFPLYSNARVFIISFPEVSEGACLEYKLRIYHSRLLNDKDFVLAWPLLAREPVLEANLCIEAPPEKELRFKIINETFNSSSAQLTPQIKKDQSGSSYSWHFQDLPQIIPEANMPPQVEINPAILVSTFSDWQEVYRWWWALAKDKLRADAAIKEKVKELTSAQASLEAKAREIYNFSVRSIRYVAIEYGQAGYEPHPAADIFRNKYGDCKDQAVLLVTMLREAGLEAYPVLIATKEYYDLNPDFPAALFDHCIAVVLLGGRMVFLDPTAETCAFGDLPAADQLRRVLIFKEDSWQIEDTPLFASGHNSLRQQLKLNITKEGKLKAEKIISTFGLYDQAQRYWFLYTMPELITETLKEKIQEVSVGARLDNYTVENTGDLNHPVVLRYAFSGPEYLIPAGRLRIVPQLANLDTSLAAKDKRRYEIDFQTLESQETLVELDLPAELAVKYLPPDIQKSSPWLEFTVEYKKNGNKIFFRQKSEAKKTEVSLEEYPAFKKFFEEVAKGIKQRIVLETR